MDIVSFEGLEERTKKQIADTEYFVEATDFERFSLWEKFADDSADFSTYDKVKWEQVCVGSMFQLGKLAKMPVTFLLTWAKINGHLVAFWESPSMVTDGRMVEVFLNKLKKPTTNANNFHHCLDFCKNEKR